MTGSQEGILVKIKATGTLKFSFYIHLKDTLIGIANIV